MAILAAMTIRHSYYGDKCLIGLLVACFIVFNPISTYDAHATTTASMLYQKKIYLAADSKLYNFSQPICKIFEVGRLYFTVAGILDASNYKFSVPQIVKQSYRATHGIQTSFNDFEERIQPKLVVYWNAWSKDHPNKMKYFASMHALSLSVTFAGFETDNSATLCGAGLAAIPPFIPGKIKVKLVKSQCNNSEQPFPNDSNLLVNGESDGYEQCKTYLPVNPTATEKCIVEKEIKLHHKEVGPPISILIISPLGSSWISQGVCPNLPLEEPPPPDRHAKGKGIN